MERLLLCQAGLRPDSAGRSDKRKRPLPQTPKSSWVWSLSGGVIRKNTLPVRPPNVTQISIFDCPHRWYRRPMTGPSIETKSGGNVGLSGLAGGPDLGFGFPEMVGFPAPIGLTGASQSTGAQKGTEGIWGKAEKPMNTWDWTKSPRKFVPIKLLCKHVTNPLKPATNCLCSPYKFMEQLGLGAFFWPRTTALVVAKNPGSSQ